MVPESPSLHPDSQHPRRFRYRSSCILRCRLAPWSQLKDGRAAIIWGPVAGATYAHLSAAKWLGVTGTCAEAFRFGFTSMMRRRFGRRASRSADYVVFGSSDSQLALSGFARRHALETNIVLEARQEAAKDPQYARQCADTSERFRLLTASRLIRWKGVELPIRALAFLPREFTLTSRSGDQRERERLLRLTKQLGVQDRVVLQGHVSREEFLQQLRNADVYIAPSLHKSIGWATAEAVANGVRVVATARGGHVDTLRGISSCRLVARSSHLPKDIAAAVREVIEEMSLRLATDG